MNLRKLSPDDPQLTAYALGELEGEERMAIENALRHDPAARAAVAEIRAMATHLSAALADEPVPGLDTAREEKVEPTGATAPMATVIDYPFGRRYEDRPRGWRAMLRFPHLYYVVGGLAAAAFAVMVALRPFAPEGLGQKRREAVPTMQVPPGTIVVNLPPRPAEVPAAADVSAPGPVPAPTVAGTVTAVGSAGAVTLSPATAVAASFENGQWTPTLIGKESLLGDKSAKVADAAPAQAAVAGAATAEAAASASVSAKPDGVPTAGAATGAMVASNAGPVPGPAIAVGSTLAAETDLRDAAASAASTSADVPVAPLLPGEGEVIHLSAFSVSAESFDRRYGNYGSGRAPAANPLPKAPPGARFGSRSEASEVVRDNPFLVAWENPLCSFAVDTNPASYAALRAQLQNHVRPAREAVRIEDMLNYFPYHYAPPVETVGAAASAHAANTSPFAAALEVADAPWAPGHRLVRIGLKGREVLTATRPAVNFVFLVDISASMETPNRLPLVKEALRHLLTRLRPDDRMAIVTFAGQSGLVLPSTPAAHAADILAALDELAVGGPASSSAGLQTAYDLAQANFSTANVNRVIVCTGGSPGATADIALERLIARKAGTGLYFSALGFGIGPGRDAPLEALAESGHGSYHPVYTRRDADKALAAEINGTSDTIAKDVHVQVEFNPEKVASYRLIGYENRLLNRDEFSTDMSDAGEFGAGNALTALYEIVPTDPRADDPSAMGRFRYQHFAGVGSNTSGAGRADPVGSELLVVKVRYHKPDGTPATRADFPLADKGRRFLTASPDFKFAAAVAEFGMILRDSPYKGSGTLNDVVDWAEAATGDDPGGYRSEFVELARDAQQVEH